MTQQFFVVVVVRICSRLTTSRIPSREERPLDSRVVCEVFLLLVVVVVVVVVGVGNSWTHSGPELKDVT